MSFNVYAISDVKEKYTHWADGLRMIIVKDEHKIELNSEEIQQLVRALPRTVGGKY